MNRTLGDGPVSITSAPCQPVNICDPMGDCTAGLTPQASGRKLNKLGKGFEDITTLLYKVHTLPSSASHGTVRLGPERLALPPFPFCSTHHCRSYDRSSHCGIGADVLTILVMTAYENAPSSVGWRTPSTFSYLTHRLPYRKRSTSTSSIPIGPIKCSLVFQPRHFAVVSTRPTYRRRQIHGWLATGAMQPDRSRGVRRA